MFFTKIKVLILKMSSLSYHAEHLAWQQRVQQEKSRSSNFYKTTGAFPAIDPSLIGTRSIFPRASVDENAINYRALKHTLGYTFGGTKPIKYSLYDCEKYSNSKSPKKTNVKFRKNSQENSPVFKDLEKELYKTKKQCENGNLAESRMAYMKKLEEKIVFERKKRIEAELKLKH